MPSTRFSRVQIPRSAGGSRLNGEVITKLAGLDRVTPVDEILQGRTPDAHDFRLYKETEGGREAAITTRKGAGFYTIPHLESLSASNTSSVGASTVEVGVQSGIQAQPFTATNSDYLTKIELKPGIGTASSVMRVDIYSDINGKPGELLTSSSIIDIPGSPDWAEARFLKQPKLTSGWVYWIVCYLQDDGAGFAQLATTTDAPFAYAGAGGIIALTQQTYAINHRVYTAPPRKVLGAYRFNRDDGVNRTLVALDHPTGTLCEIYVIDEATSSLKLLVQQGFPSKDYYFSTADGKVFFSNGSAQANGVITWNGIFHTEAVNLITNSSFATDTLGWTAMAGTTLTRITSDFATAPASMQVTGSGNRGATFTVGTISIKKVYSITFKAKALTAGANVGIKRGAAASGVILANNISTTTWTTVSSDAVAFSATDTAISIYSDNGNFLVDDVRFVETGVAQVSDTDIVGGFSDVVFHKDRLFGVSAADRNKLVFSENPGNPSNLGPEEQWYNQFLSVNFIYVPRPKNGSPIVALESFQDTLVILTQDSKYMLTGTDRGNFYLRQAIGTQGALSKGGVVADANFIYSVSDDGIYEFNGAQDVKISGLVQPIFDKCPNKREIKLVLWHGQLRVHMASEFSTVNDMTLIYDKEFKEWMLDTDTYVSRGVYYEDADDQMELVEFSSTTGQAFYAESDFNNLGGPIDFKYTLRYDSRGIPGQRKKYKKYVPLVQSVGRSFPITYGVDKDFENSPRTKQEQLNVGGARIGDFFVDDGTIITGATAFKPKKTSISGNSHYMQFGVSRKAVNNQVAFMGVQFTYKAKKL